MAGAESPDFSAIIMLCDSVALQSDRYPVRIPRIGVAVIVTVPYARTSERHELSLSFRNGEASQSFFNIDRPQDLPPARRAIPVGLNMVMASPLQGHRLPAGGLARCARIRPRL